MYCAKQFAQPTGERGREKGSEEKKQGVGGTKRTRVMAEGLEWRCNSSSTSPTPQVKLSTQRVACVRQSWSKAGSKLG